MKISDSESRVLEVLWDAGEPLSADEVIARVDPGQGWSPGTIRTFLTRLVKKKAADAAQDGRRYLYRPLVRREDYVHAESRNLIDRLFGGRIAPFVTRFSEKQDLSREEIAELKRLIERLERNG